MCFGSLATKLGRGFSYLEPLIFFVLIAVNTWNLFEKYNTFHSDSPERLRTVPRQRTDGLRLPHALIIGASKCGTIPFAGFLRLNPKIAFTGHWPRFYNHDDTYNNKGVKWYNGQFAALNASRDQIILDGNAAYLTDPKVPSRVAAVDPNIKIIVILREPISRIVSDFAQAIVAKRKAAGMPEVSFRDVFIDKRTQEVNIVTPGLIWSVYEVHIRRWLQYFPMSQMHIIDGEEFLRDPLNVVRNAESFLGIPHRIAKQDLAFNRTTGYFCVRRPTYVQCFGHGRNWNRPYVDKLTYEALRDFFRPYNEKLFGILGKRFNWLK